MKWPVWITRGGRGFYVGRDNRGHFTDPETIEEPCPHACCQGPQRTVTLRRQVKPAKPAKRRRTRAPRRVPSRDGFGSVPWVPRQPAGSSSERRASRGRAARSDHAAYLDAHYRDADDATNGYMVNAAGKAKGITGADFFKPGRRPSVQKWGLDELRDWFRVGDAGSRRILSAGEFAAQQRQAA